MKNRIIYAIYLSALLLALLALNAAAEDKPSYDPTSVIVELKQSGISLYSADAESAQQEFEKALEEIGVEEIVTLNQKNQNAISLFSANEEESVLKLVLTEDGEESIQNAIKRLSAVSNVENVQPNYYYYLDSTPNDSYYTTGNQYFLTKIGAEYVWNLNIDCSDVRVAVLDTGALMKHEDLWGNIWTNPGEIEENGIDDDRNGYIDDVSGWNFVANTNDPSDDNGHGTHVCGIAGAVTNNSKGVASLSRNVGIVPLKIFTSTGSTSSEYIYKALLYVRSMDFEVVNCSWGGNEYDALIDKYIKRCSDTVFTAAAGNAVSGYSPVNIDNYPMYPASSGLSNVITVASTDRYDNISSFSNYGKNSVGIAAPGTAIYSTYYSSKSSYKSMNGTSMATPVVSSTLAVMRAANPKLTPEECISVLKSGADTVSGLSGYVNGSKRLNAYESVKMVMPTPTPSPTPSPSPTPTPSPTPSPTPMPEASNVELFSSGDELKVRVVFGEDVDIDSFKVYAIYKDNGELKCIEKIQLGEDYTATISQPEGLEGITPEIYVWSNSLQPLYHVVSVENG